MFPTVTRLFIVCIIIFLTASNVWAIASYSQKYGMGCKGCHGFGSSLNDRGLTYKKKIDTSGDDESAKLKSDKTGVGGNGPTETSLPEARSEAKVYRLNAENGIPIFTDNPLNTLPVEKKSAEKKIEKNIVRGRAKPRLATVGKTQSDRASVNVKPNAVTPILPLSGPSTQPKTAQTMPLQKRMSVTFEKCMETFLVKQPQPINPEAAMLQFSEAEVACANYAK